MRLPAGFVLRSDYRIDDFIGQGGFGLTYRAMDRSLSVPVAIKEFFPRIAVRNSDMSVGPRSEADRAQFEQDRRRYFGEAQSLARFKHDAIVRVFGIFEENATVYIVLEFIDGIDVETWLRHAGNPSTSGGAWQNPNPTHVFQLSHRA